MTAEYCSEKCTMRQLSTLFKMQTLSITKDTYQFCTLACSFEREIEKGKGEQGNRKKTNSRNSSFEYKPHIDIKTGRPPTLEQNKDVQFTREICDAYWKEKKKKKN